MADHASLNPAAVSAMLTTTAFPPATGRVSERLAFETVAAQDTIRAGTQVAEPLARCAVNLYQVADRLSPVNIGASLIDNGPSERIEQLSSITQCEHSPPRDNPDWASYKGDSRFFHCGYETYVENRQPMPENPIAECVYDYNGRLVDADHEYPSCRGTPNQYASEDVIEHTCNDSGGILKQGAPAAAESLKKTIISALQRLIGRG